ncbi:hypothetical protein [Kribbella swartbergensis]
MTASKAIADRLNIQQGDPVMRTSYRFMADGEPVMLSTSFEPLRSQVARRSRIPKVVDHRGNPQDAQHRSAHHPRGGGCCGSRCTSARG